MTPTQIAMLGLVGGILGVLEPRLGFAFIAIISVIVTVQGWPP
jgi:hypothetical protein